MQESPQSITVSATINAAIEKVWKLWTTPKDIMQWNNASDDWHTPKAENDLKVGGKFTCTMAAKDGSVSFDFWGIYDAIETHKSIAYTMGDGRKAHLTFTEKGNTTEIIETFDAETENTVELQQGGWQAILNNFKKHAEKSKKKKQQKITPFLWFNDNAEEATTFYTSVFENSKIQKMMRMPDGKVLTVGFQLVGQDFAAINGGPMFKINPSVSFYVACETEAEVTSLWEKLFEGGSVMLPLDKYPWSEKYGWLQDRFGMTWQITVDKNLKQKITPSMLFTQNQHGKGKEALDFYTTLFDKASIEALATYQKGQNEYATEGMVLFSHFQLNGQSFIIMDAGFPQPYTFNEAISFVINCTTQKEIDYYWGKITGNGGAESMCGWAKDKYGVSWQIVPTNLGKLLANPNAMAAMLKMKKLDIKTLKEA